jgi:hypothetical protein
VPQHWSDAERLAVHRHVSGAAGGASGDVRSNRDFEHLWLRFVTSVALFSRQDLQRAHPPGGSLDLVRSTGRDLAAAAIPRIDAAWSQRDMWSAIDRSATSELGGAANAARHRALAQVGGAVLEWVAAHRDAPDAMQGNDRALSDAVEQWLAVAATPDADVETYATPGAATARVTEWSRALFEALGFEKAAASAQRGAPLRLAAVFDGAADTGKTLAAHWLASSLGRDVLRVDLSQVASKYIGETEKNLDRVFDSATRSGAVLLLDEADALFGKRTEVRDAHDRYANVEVNDLLQRIESHNGVAIVTTNTSTQIDPALFKRAKATVVAFPLPPR